MPSASSLDGIGLRRGAIEASDGLDHLLIYERAIGALTIPLTDIVMVLEGKWFESANTFAEAWPDSTIHFLGSGAVEPDLATLLPNVRYTHCPTSADRRQYIRDRLASRPQVIIEHGVNKPERKRVNFRSLFWALPAGGFYAVEALEPTTDPGIQDGETVLGLLQGAARDANRSEEELRKLPVFDAELARGASPIEFHGTLAIAHKRTDHVFKLREWEDHAAYERRWGSGWGELLHTELAYQYEPRSTIHTYGDGPQEQRTIIAVPERHLRRHLDVTCHPRRLLTRDGYVLAESFRHPHKGRLTHPQLVNTSRDFGRYKRRNKERSVDGEFFYFDSAFPGHFGHVTTEQLSHMWGWEHARTLNPSVRPIMSVAASGLHEYQYQLFAALGIEPDSIELVQHDEAVHVDSMITSTPAFENPHYVDLDMARVWTNLLHGLPPDEMKRRPEKIFVSRKVGSQRGAANTPDIEKYFKKRGFAVIYPEDLAYAEQAHTFAAAKVIGGFSGSGMFNMMFNPDATIILISGDSYIAQNEYLFASVNGNEIHYFWGESQHKSPDGRFDSTAFHSHFEFDLKRSRKDLKSILR